MKNLPIYLGLEDNKSNSKQIQYSKERIQFLKDTIKELTLKTQELILKSCSYSDLELVRDNQGVKDFKNKLYNFKEYIITTENYQFYNEFYIQMMEKLDKKRELIEKYGVLEAFKEIPQNLSLIETRRHRLNLLSVAKEKLITLFKLNKQEIEEDQKDN